MMLPTPIRATAYRTAVIHDNNPEEILILGFMSYGMNRIPLAVAIDETGQIRYLPQKDYKLKTKVPF